MSYPRTQINSDDATIEEDAISTVVTLLENGLPSCHLVANNYKGKLYLQNLKLYSKVTVKFAYEDNGTINWTSVEPVFTGRIVDIGPEMTSRGETLVATALDGECWKQVRINREYENWTLYNMIADVKDNFISKLLNDVTVTLPDDFVPNIDYVYTWIKMYPYMNFPFVDGMYFLNELIKMGSSLKYVTDGANFTGLHWTILPNNKLAIAPVGNHSVYSGANFSYYVEDVWKTRCPLDPIIVKEDMIHSNFKTEIPLANVVLVAGKFVYPYNDAWTESLDGWNDTYESQGGAGATVTLSLNNTTFIRDNNSLQLKIDLTAGAQAWVELYRSLQLDFTKFISEDVNGYFDMQIYGNMKGQFIKFRLYCNNDTPILHYYSDIADYAIKGSYFEVDLTSYLPISGTEKWHKIELPITSNDLVDVTREGTWTAHNDTGYDAPSWNNIKWIVIFIHTGQAGATGATDNWLFDDMCIVGSMVRGAYTNDCGQTSVDNCTVGCIKHYGIRTYTVRDSLAQTDSLDANNDNNTLGQVALYELLRNRIPRTSATIQIPLYPSIKAGQIVHIKYNQLENGTYVIDKDFRITKVQHQYSVEGAKTTLDIIDDLRNSVPIKTTDPYTVLVRAVNPDTQTKTFASLKSEGKFITGMKVLWKQYNT